jgi:hypothetical protein
MSLSRTLGTLPLVTLLASLTLGLIPGPSSIAGAADESTISPSIASALRLTGSRLRNSFHPVGFKAKE